MGKIITPTYRVEYRDNLLAMGKTSGDCRSRIDGRPVLSMAWNGKEDGWANETNLEAWRKGYNASFQPAGSNAHLAAAFGIVPHISFARLVRQSNDTVVAEVRMPMFEVV